MERVVERLKMEGSFDDSYYSKGDYLNHKTLRLAVFGLIKLKTAILQKFILELQPLAFDFFVGQKPYFILEFDSSRAHEVVSCYNGKQMVLGGQKCTVYAIPLNPAFCPDLPRRPLVGELGISSSIQGLKYIENYVSTEDQIELLSRLEGLNWQETLNRRKVIHYGYRFDYQTSVVDKSARIPIPFWLRGMIQHVGQDFDQITINRYEPGDGIASHCDTHSSFMHTMYIISLGSEIVMEFKNLDHSVDILLQVGSRLEIGGDARYGYDHGIKPRKVDVVGGMIQDRNVRYSITIRQTRNGLCDCKFKLKCY